VLGDPIPVIAIAIFGRIVIIGDAVMSSITIGAKTILAAFEQALKASAILFQILPTYRAFSVLRGIKMSV
jgi:hypothetical protein